MNERDSLGTPVVLPGLPAAVVFEIRDRLCLQVEVTLLGGGRYSLTGEPDEVNLLIVEAGKYVSPIAGNYVSETARYFSELSA